VVIDFRFKILPMRVPCGTIYELEFAFQFPRSLIFLCIVCVCVFVTADVDGFGWFSGGFWWWYWWWCSVVALTEPLKVMWPAPCWMIWANHSLLL